MARVLLPFLVTAPMLVTACNKDDPRTPLPSAGSATEVEHDHVEDVLAIYERARAALAADETARLGDLAYQLEAAAGAASRSEPADVVAHYKAIAAAAKQLASSDLAAARRGFGEISRALIALVASDPALARGLHVFECPTADGYTKWIQPTTAPDDPYMGRGEPPCGKEATWE